MAGEWRSRIVGYGELAPEDLLSHSHSWRIHPGFQQAALEALLDRIGWVEDVTVSRRTGRVLDGHLRVRLAMRRGESKVPVRLVDLDQDEEDEVVATFDRIGNLAGTDRGLLDELAGRILEGLPMALLKAILPRSRRRRKGLSPCPNCGYTPKPEDP